MTLSDMEICEKYVTNDVNRHSRQPRQPNWFVCISDVIDDKRRSVFFFFDVGLLANLTSCRRLRSSCRWLRFYVIIVVLLVVCY